MLPSCCFGEERRAAVPRLGCTEVTKGPNAMPGVASSPEAQHRAVMEKELKKGQTQWSLTSSFLLGPNDLFLPQPSQQSVFSHNPTTPPAPHPNIFNQDKAKTLSPSCQHVFVLHPSIFPIPLPPVTIIPQAPAPVTSQYPSTFLIPQIQ